jgi:3' terminal RNA ribose 2'-O-methyltransferase Hen1
MLLTITSTSTPATDLGFVLHKNPDRVHEVELSFGTARVGYPEATDSRCTAAVMVDIDPVALVRNHRHTGAVGLDHYVNDRPYAASSFLSVALTKLFGTAMTGRSKERPELADSALPLELHLPVASCRGGVGLLRSLFEPLGYTVDATPIELDATMPQWGMSRYVDLRLMINARVHDVLEHLFVLLPVLDDDKHYWVSREEVDKLLRRGGQWLTTHPQRELITRRYLRHDATLTRSALAQLMAADNSPDDPDATQERNNEAEAALEKPARLNDLRMDAVVDALRDSGAQRIADLGCGEGALIRRLLSEAWVDRVVGIDVSWRSLEIAARRLHLDDMAPRQRARVDLWQGAFTYRDRRLREFDALAVVEVIEHIDEARLGAFEDALFGDAHAKVLIITTPNVEYNPLFEGMPQDRLRHNDHRFEWTRAQFERWGKAVASRHDYAVTFCGIGASDVELGCPTQMAVFVR